MSLPYYHCSDRGREVMMEAELGIKMTSPAHILWIDLFRDPETFAGRIHHIIGWLGVSEHRLLFYDPLVEEEEFQMREPAAQSRAPSTWSGDDDTIQAEEVIFAEDGYRFRPLTGIARESALPLASCHRATILDLSEDERAPESPIDLSDSSEEAPLEGDGEAGPGRSHTHGFDEVADEATPAIDIVEEAVVAPMSPIRSAGGGGSAGSVDETPGVLKDVGCRSPIVSMGSGGEVSVATGRTSAALISESVSVVPVAHSPGSFSHIGLPLPRGGGIDDLNVDNNHRPLGLLGADAPILSSSFYLVSPGRAERSPSSVHQAGSSHEGGPAHRRVSFPDGGTDVVSGRAVKPIAPVEGGAIEAVVPDNDKGSGGNSSTGQHVPTGSNHHIAVGGGSSQREGSKGSSSGPAPPLDINVEFVELFQSRCITLPFAPEYVHAVHIRFLNKERQVRQLNASVEGDGRQYHLALEARNQQIEERNAKVALINPAKTRLAKIDAKLPSLQKLVEEQGVALLMDSGCIKKVEHDLLSALSEMKRIKEAEIAPLGLALILSALEMFRAASRDGLSFS
ncbi:hypothetical protein ACLOJK_036720 [Asimina triloba]